ENAPLPASTAAEVAALARKRTAAPHVRPVSAKQPALSLGDFGIDRFVAHAAAARRSGRAFQVGAALLGDSGRGASRGYVASRPTSQPRGARATRRGVAGRPPAGKAAPRADVRRSR